MKRVAYATLYRARPRERQCTVEIVELDLPAQAAHRHVVTLRQGLLQGGVVLAPQDSSLTAVPCSLEDALQRARDFIHRRLAAGEQLRQHDGLPGLVVEEVPAVLTPQSSISAPTGGPVPARITALVARFSPERWQLLPAAQRSRAVWRLAECSDPAGGAGQRALVALVPRLVDLLETGDDLLDLCIAVAIARLGDAGAAVAMQALTGRGRAAGGPPSLADAADARGTARPCRQPAAGLAGRDREHRARRRTPHRAARPPDRPRPRLGAAAA